MKITSKKEFYEKATLGLCGNTPRTWGSLEQIHAEWYQLPWWVGLRGYRVGAPGVARISKYNALVKLTFEKDWTRYGFAMSEIPYEGGNNERGLQGELSWVNGEWWLYYTHAMGYMRQRLAESGQHAAGWAAIRLLRGHLTPSDFDMLMDLFDRYTEGCEYPVIEFANFRKPWGRLDRNLIIWEIRNGY